MPRSTDEIAAITRQFLLNVAKDPATRAQLASIFAERGTKEKGTALAALITQSLRIAPPFAPNELDALFAIVHEIVEEMPPDSWNLFNTVTPPYHTEIEEEGE